MRVNGRPTLGPLDESLGASQRLRRIPVDQGIELVELLVVSTTQYSPPSDAACSVALITELRIQLG